MVYTDIYENKCSTNSKKEINLTKEGTNKREINVRKEKEYINPKAYSEKNKLPTNLWRKIGRKSQVFKIL